MAWYPYFDFGKTLTPTIDDQSEGYHGIDFLAAVSEKKENYKNTVGLTFKHQMAKVRCMLYKGDGVTEEDIKTAKVSYFGYTKAEFSKAGLSGDENGWITPTEDFTALLVPQDMSGRPFIEVKLTVKVNGVSIDKTLTYTPEQGSGNLEAGKAYTYKITVQKDRLVAQTVSGQWNDDNGSEDADQVRRRVNLNIPEGNELNLSFSNNVEPVSGDTRAGSNPEYLLVKGKEFTISYSISGNSSTKGIIPSVRDEANITMTRSLSKGVYTFQYTLKSQTEETVGLDYADYVQIGDIYYNDGTWSSDTIEGKTPIGIVFKTDTIGTGDEPVNYGWAPDRRIRGYVVALEDASESKGSWQTKIKNTDSSFLMLTDGATQKANDSRYCGYLNAVQIRGTDSYPDYTWACKVADEYQKDAPAPVYDKENPDNPYYSSGWYLPSYKQLQDLYYLYRLNLFFQKADGKPFRDEVNDKYWSSTEYRSSAKYSQNAYVMNFYQGPSTNSAPKNSSTYYSYVRSVLTF